MATVTTNDQHYADIAAAIRAKNEEETQYLPSQMAAAIAALETGAAGLTVTSGNVTYTTSEIQSLDTGLSNILYFIMYSNNHEDTHTYGIEMLVHDSSTNRSWASVKESSSYAYRCYLSDAFKKDGGVVTIGSTRNSAYKPQKSVNHRWVAFGN